MILHKYKIYCETDGKYEYTDYRDSTLPTPTTCPADATHTATLDSATIVEKLDLSIHKSEVVSFPSMSAKTLPDGSKLFKRVHGIRSDVVVGVNAIEWVSQYPHAKFLAVEFLDSTGGEWVDLEIFDDALGTYSGEPNGKLNQFGFTANIAKDYYAHKSEFDADLYFGMKIKITYHAKALANVGVNFVMNEVKAVVI